MKKIYKASQPKVRSGYMLVKLNKVIEIQSTCPDTNEFYFLLLIIMREGYAIEAFKNRKFQHSSFAC